VTIEYFAVYSTPQLRHQQRENIRLKLVVSDEDDTVFGGCDKAMLPTAFPSCRSSCASLSMCYVNEAAFDDDDSDDSDSMHCYPEEPDVGPSGSPDIIAGMRRANKQKHVPYENDSHLSAELGRKTIGEEALVCSYTVLLQL